MRSIPKQKRTCYYFALLAILLLQGHAQLSAQDVARMQSDFGVTGISLMLAETIGDPIAIAAGITLSVALFFLGVVRNGGWMRAYVGCSLIITLLSLLPWLLFLPGLFWLA